MTGEQEVQPAPAPVSSREMCEASAEAVRRIRAFMSEAGYEAVLLRTRANFAWATGGRDNHIVQTDALGVADLVVFHDRVVCVTTRMEATRIQEEELDGLGFDLETAEWVDGTDGTLRRLLDGKRVASDVHWPGAADASADLSRLRRQLTPAAIRQYRWVCRAAAETLEDVARGLRPGETEHEIAGRLSAALISRGLSPAVVLVATDERVFRYRHPIPTAKRLDRYAMLVVCAEKYGLVANATRFVHFGPLPADIAENRLKCARIDVRMNHATRPGVRVGDVLREGMEAYREAGYPDDWRLLHQGGPAGYAPREYLATPDSRDRIRPGEAYAWNPSVRGIKSEDTLWVGPEDNEFLTHTGNWVYLKIPFGGKTYERPDVWVITG
ncbi:MAG: M24 family metallopeptidase [Alicyclobacillus sp.]|nr:M24 family metallopeptidase [Alicyclobacillus sp.]